MQFSLSFRRLAQGSSVAFVIQSAGLVLQFVAQVELARWMSNPAEYGAYGLARSWMQLFAMAATLGLTTAALRFVPQYTSRQEWGLLAGFLRTSRRLMLGTGIGLAAAAAAVLALLQPERPLWGALLIGFALVPLLAVQQFQMQWTRASEKIALAFLPSFVLQPLALLGFAGLWYYSSESLNGYQAMVCLAAAMVLVLLSQRAILARCTPREMRDAVAQNDVQHWLATSLPMALSSLSLLLIANADILLLGMLRGKAEAGIYLAATRSARLSAFFLTAVNAMVAPMISRANADNNRQALADVTHFAITLVFWPSLLIAGAIVWFGRDLLSLFGPQFVEGELALRILIGGQLCNALTGPVGLLLTLSGHQRASMRVYLYTAGINLGLHLLLIPTWGGAGAALGTAISLIVANLSLAWLVWRHLQFMPLAIPVVVSRRHEPPPEA